MTRYFEQVTELFERNLYPVYQMKSSDPQEYIPYDIIAPYEAQALRNHGQTLHRLAERGGLDWSEILDILRDNSWGTSSNMERDNAKNAVLHYIAERKVQDE